MTTHLVIAFPSPEEIVVDLATRNKSLQEPADDQFICCGGISSPYLAVLTPDKMPLSD